MISSSSRRKINDPDLLKCCKSYYHLYGGYLSRKKSANSDTVRKIVDLFLRFNRRLNFAVQRVPHDLSINESHVLMEIGYHPEIYAKQLCGLLYLDKSNISRIVSRLEKRGLCLRKDSAKDRREKLLQLTSKGRVVLKRDSQVRNEMAMQCVLALKPEELAKLCLFLERIADNLGAHPISIREGDQPIKIAIRRLTRSMGFLGDNVLSTGLPIEKLQILYNLFKQQSGMAMGKLREILPYELSALSRLLSDLKKDRIIKKSSNSIDGRKLQLDLTSKGHRLIEDGIESASLRIGQGIINFSDREKKDLIEILELFLKIPDFIIYEGRDPELFVRPLKSKDEREMARIKIVENFVKNKRTAEIPHLLIDQSNLCLGLFRNQELIGVCEVILGSQASRIEEILILDEKTNKEHVIVLLERALRESFRDISSNRVAMPITAHAATWFEPLSDQNLSDANHLIFTRDTHLRLESLIK